MRVPRSISRYVPYFLLVAIELALVVAVLVPGRLSLVPIGAKADVSIAARLGPDYVSMASVAPSAAPPPPSLDGSTGSFTWDCGRNEARHRNTANVVVAPGSPGHPHHVHDYVGNLTVGTDSTVESLRGAPTSCANGDASTYFWPVLRRAAAGVHDGPVLAARSVDLTFTGNPRTRVVPMPHLLRSTVGDATAITNGDPRVRAVWTCSDMLDRRTTRYPVCDPGSQVLRIFDFPSCWDGRRLDSPNHRDHLTFPVAGGGCPRGTFAVPALRLTLSYDLAPGTPYRIDAFDGQRNSPLTDHAFMVNLMPEKLMAQVVDCLNSGRTCGAATSGGR